MSVLGPMTATRISTGTTRIRQTPPTGSERFGEALRVGGQALLAGAQGALRLLPGGEVLCAAVRDGAAAARNSGSSRRGGDASSPIGSGGTATTEESDLWAMTQQSQEFNLMYLQLQQEMSQENRRYSALSNVLKTRHETARSVISNI